MHPKALALQDRTHQFFLRVTRDAEEAGALIHESDELTAILTASHKTACHRRAARRQSLSDAKIARPKR